MGTSEEVNNQLVVLHKNQVTVLCKVTNHKNTPVKTPIATPYLMEGFSKKFSKLLQKPSLPVGTSERKLLIERNEYDGHQVYKTAEGSL